MLSDVTPAADIAVMGAILLAGLGVTPERGGVGIEMTAAHAGAAGMNVAEVFRWMFVAALAFAIVAMAAIILMEERPLHGPAAKVTPPVVPDAAPAE
jgi:Na+/H+ antiporter NhaC